MERIIDYLAEEEKKQAEREATKARKDGKKARINKLLTTLCSTPEPQFGPVLDFLAMGD